MQYFVQWLILLPISIKKVPFSCKYLCLFTVSAILLRIQSEFRSTYTQNLFTFHETSQLTALTTTCVARNLSP